VNKHNLAKGLFAALLVASSVVSADEKYPAADFQPTVVYQSNEIKSTQTAAKEAAPVATAPAAAHHEVDSKYPAADFQPKVLYSDNNYKHDKSVPVAKSYPKSNNTSSASVSSEEVAVEAVAEKKKEDSSMTYLLGLVGLAAAGFFLFRQQATPAPAKTKKASVAPASAKVAATTGVGKYINKVSGTGVSRYVEQQVKVAKSATSVSKYVAQKTLADKAKAAEEAEKKATGVEKYMRNRG
jgi:hypothetical protein